MSQVKPDFSYITEKLLRISAVMDEPLNNLRLKQTETKHVSWVITLILKSIGSVKGVKSSSDNIVGMIQKISANAIVLWGLSILGITGHQMVPWLFWMKGWGWFVLPILLGNALFLTFTRMVDTKDEWFNMQAYIAFRKNEHALVSYFLNDDPTFSFKHLYEEIQLVRANQTPEPIVINNQNLLDEMATELNSKRKVNESQAAALLDITNIYKEMEQQASFLRVILEQALIIIQRLALSHDGSPTRFKESDLRIFSAYSLYEVQRKQLVMISESGTSETPKTISFKDPKFTNYISVKLVRENKDLIKVGGSDREGRAIVSYLINMPDRSQIVYNFHIPSTDRELCDMINSQESYRLIKGILYHLVERGLLIREVDQYEQSS